jgi:hypothetical protein
LFARIDVGFVNEIRYLSGIGYRDVKRIVIERAQRICRERKELFWEVGKGKSKKIENNHTDKKVNVDVKDFSKDPR